MGDAMRDWGCEVDLVQAEGVCSAITNETRVEAIRRLVLVGLTLALLVAGVLVGRAQAAESCPNATSRQGPSVNLPECRVYEQVTPVDKGDAVDIFDSSFFESEGFYVTPGNEAYVAEDGDAILVKTDGSFAPDATESASAYVFSRGAEGWRTNVLAQPIDEPQEVGEDPEFVFNPHDLSEVGFNDEVGTYSELFSGHSSAFRNTELVGPAAGPYAPLFSLSGSAVLNEGEHVEMAGGSEDLSRVVLQGENHSLAAGAEEQDPETDALYESTGGGECGLETSTCRLVDVNSEGRAMPCGATLGQGEGKEDNSGEAHSAVSSDGSRIFFTAPEPVASGVGCWNPGMSSQENPPELYMRENGMKTVEISKPEEGVEVGTPENPLLLAAFVGASNDGSKVFFMTRMQLTKAAVGHTPELYEYNTEPREGEKALKLISGGQSGTLEGDVDSVTAVSSEGSAVYFTAFGQLATGASQYTPGGGSFSPVNLYRYDTLTGETTYIAALNKYDYPGFFANGPSWYSNEFGNSQGTFSEGLFSAKEWYTTGDGQFLLFGTILPLTGFDNTHAEGESCPDNYPGESIPEKCFELYRYDAATGQIVCVSCAGSAPVDGAYFARTRFASPMVGPPRPISENGQDVFFESANVLVPQAIPGRDHVYEWHEGTISLISSPSDPGNAFFLGSSAEGSNVFFVTHAQLSPQDTDQAADIYDARVDGGVAGLTPPQCTGTGCQGVPAAPPIFATPASATFEGVGNFTTSEPPVEPASKPNAKAKKCRAGSVKKNGVCVKRKARKAKRSARGRK